MISESLCRQIDEWVEANRVRIVSLVRDLVCIASENHPPSGSERAVQEFLSSYLAREGFQPDLYDISDVPGLAAHPLRHPSVDCRGRPNVSLRLPGTHPAEARSLILSGHCDTVPAGDPDTWRDSPTSGRVEGNRLYGRGAYDMKAGVAANAAVAVLLRDLDIALKGDLTVESVVTKSLPGAMGRLPRACAAAGPTGSCCRNHRT